MVDHSQDDRMAESSVGQGSADDPAYTIEQALSNLQQTEDPSARYYAAWWIGRFRVNEPMAIETPMYGDILVEALQAKTLQVRRSALMDLGVIGYLGAVDAIANTLAENSLKLISLKGILEHHLTEQKQKELNDDLVHLMNI